MTSPDFERRCERYARLKLWLSALEFLVLLGTLAGLTLSGTAGQWFHTLNAHPSTPYGPFFRYVALVTAVSRLAVLPVHFLSGHLVERRFHLSRQSMASWLMEWTVTSLLGGVALVLLATPLLLEVHWWPILLLPGLAAGLLLRLAYYEWLFLPILSLFYPVRFLRTECLYLPGLGRRMLPVYEVKVSHKTRRANAGILLGRHPRVLVTDTLIEAFSDAEERVAIAHEFGHLYDHLFLEARTAFGLAQAKRKVIWNGAAWLIAAVMAFALASAAGPVLGLPRVDDPASAPLLSAMLLFFAPLVLPFGNAEARTDEREADEYALRITHDPTSYLSVMDKLHQINLEERRPGLISRLFFDTHPSYLERIRLGRAFRRQGKAVPARRSSVHPNRRHAPQRHRVHGPPAPPRRAPRAGGQPGEGVKR